MRPVSLVRWFGLCLILLSGVLPLQAHAAGKGRAFVVQHGVLTVDGLTVKTGLNLRVNSLHYLFVYLPGAGTCVVAEQPFPGAREQKGAFRGNSLTVLAGERTVQLTAANRLRTGNRSAFVRFEAGAGPGLRLPALTYGDSALLPAVWPEEVSPLRSMRVSSRIRRRSLRTAKLCRPSPRGREACATVREVVYKP